jgi:hypothetical protein
VHVVGSIAASYSVRTKCLYVRYGLYVGYGRYR